jgi:putative oxidoreductase
MSDTMGLRALEPRMLSILRIMVGLLFMEHGTAKLLGFPPGTAAPALFALAWFAGVIELVGGALVAVGLFTRYAAFIMSGEMAIGYFLVHAPQGFFPMINRGEGAVLYCFIFLYLAVAGGGSWSLDRVISGDKSTGRLSPA